MKKLEQQIWIKFCFKLEKSCAEIIEIMKIAILDECIGNKQIKEWYKWFEDGCTSVDSKLHSRWPLTTKTNDNIEHEGLAINEDCWLTMQEVADGLGMVKSKVWRIATEDLQMVRMCAKFISKLLTDEYKKPCVEIAQDNL